MYGISEPLLQRDQVLIEIDNLMRDYLYEIPSHRRNKCKKQLAEFISEMRTGFHLFFPFTHKHAPHNNRRIDALEEIAVSAARLNGALQNLTKNQYIQDFMSLQHELEKIEPEEEKFGITFSSLLGFADYFHENNPLYMTEVEGTLLARFSHKRTGIYKLLSAIESAARICAKEIPAIDGGPPKNYLNEFFVAECAKIFLNYKLNITASDKNFQGFVSAMYMLVTGTEKALEGEIKEIAKKIKQGRI